MSEHSGNAEAKQITYIIWSLLAYLLLLGALWIAVEAFTAPFARIDEIPLDPAHASISADKRAELTIAAYEHVAKLALGILGVIGFALAVWRTWIAERNLKTERDRLATETFSEAINQLGARDTSGKPILEIRLGGIYTLERLMRETDDREFYWQIVETLTAYVRENAPASGAVTFTLPPPPDDWSDVNKHNQYKEDLSKKVSALPPPRKDIQAIVTVIGRRQKSKDNGRVPDLSDSNLRKIKIVKSDAGKLDLSRARLEGSWLKESNLQGSYLGEVHLEGANLHEAHLEGANLHEAHLEGANLFKAHLERANLIVAHLEGAGLSWAHLEGTNMWSASLTGANLKWANLKRADMAGARLMGARLMEALLEGAQFSDPNPIFGYPSDWDATGLTVAQLEQAYGDDNTLLPTYLEDEIINWGAEAEADEE